jgi:YceI-like domain
MVFFKNVHLSFQFNYTAMWFTTAIYSGLAFIALAMPLPEKPVAKTIEYSFMKGSTVTINGTTNVKDFSCVSDELFSGLQATFYQDDSIPVLHFNDATLNFNIESLDCGNKGMNHDLFRALKGDKYPAISIQLQNAGIMSGTSFNLSDWQQLKIQVFITLAGVTQPAEIMLKAKKTGNNEFQFIGEHQIIMSQFGITPPTALFGLIHVNDNILVKFNLLIRIQVVG